MADLDELEWLQEWYRGNCDGLWEHGSGIAIETLDNPGWRVDINLRDTRFSGLQHEKLKIEKAENDWIVCSIEDEKFKGYGDAMKLKEIIAVFRDWVETAGSQP
jgi:hypothetical protein